MSEAALYARYSSSLQKATSIDDQVALCRNAAARWELTPVAVYSDEELSGATTQRPGYQRLLADAKAHRFAAVIVEAQDRLWRSQAEMHAALDRFRFWGIKVYSVETGADLTDPTGSIVATVMGLRDQTFLTSLRDKVRRGMLGQLHRGFSPGGRAYGYRSEPIMDPSRTDPYGQPFVVGYRRVIDRDEAVVVRKIFAWYNQGLSPKTIARRLNEQGVPPPRWREGVPAKGWTGSTINGCPKKGIGILHNPIYVGKLVWNRSQKVRDPDGVRRTRQRDPSEWITVPAPQLRIVSDEVWAAAQARWKPAKPGKQHPRTLLSGLMICGVCGAHYVAKSAKYYGCAGNMNRGPTVCANGQLTRRDVLEPAIVGLVKDQMYSPDAIAYATSVYAEMVRKRSQKWERARKRELLQAAKEMDGIKSAIRAGVITPTTKAMLEEAEAKMARLSAEPKLPPPSDVGTVTRRYLKKLDEWLYKDTERARAILAMLVEKIVLKPTAEGLVAELSGDLAGVLQLPTSGARRGI